MSYKLEEEILEMLQEIADREHRSNANTLEWLIKKEYEKEKAPD